VENFRLVVSILFGFQVGLPNRLFAKTTQSAKQTFENIPAIYCWEYFRIVPVVRTALTKGLIEKADVMSAS
jgi:hypothetical protein